MDVDISEKALKLEEIIDRKMKPVLVAVMAELDKVFEQQKIFSDLRRNIESLEKYNISNLQTMVNLGSEVYVQADVKAFGWCKELQGYTKHKTSCQDTAIMRKLTVQPQVITDKRYLEHIIKYAINCGVTDQWLLGRALGHPPREDMENEVEPKNGISSISEREYLTVKAVS